MTCTSNFPISTLLRSGGAVCDFAAAPESLSDGRRDNGRYRRHGRESRCSGFCTGLSRRCEVSRAVLGRGDRGRRERKPLEGSRYRF